MSSEPWGWGGHAEKIWDKDEQDMSLLGFSTDFVLMYKKTKGVFNDIHILLY